MHRRTWILFAIACPILAIALVLAWNRPPSPFRQVDPGVRVLGYKFTTGSGRYSMFLGGSELEGRIKQPVAWALGRLGASSVIRPLTQIHLGTPPPNKFAILLRYSDEAGAAAPALEASLQDAHGRTAELRQHGIGYDPQGRERAVLWYLALVPDGFEKGECRLVLKKGSKVVATANISIGSESNQNQR